MSYPRQSATIMTTVATIEADRGPYLTHYAIPADMPVLFKWVPADTKTPDSVAVLDHSGGEDGNWLRQRLPIKGTDLTDASVDITVGGNYWRRMPSSVTLADDRILTMKTTNAAAGDMITISRFAGGAKTLTIHNDGPAAGDLFVLPASEKWWATVYFDGTDWVAHSAGKMP